MTALNHVDVAAQLVTADVPVLLLDTCFILDIVRAPIRDNFGVHDIDAVSTLLERLLKTPPGVSLVITELVKHEFFEHIDEIESKTLKALNSLTEQVASILERMAALSPGQDIPRGIDLQSLGFPANSRRLAEKIFHMSTVLADHIDERNKASDRVIFVKPPATKATQSFKDCLITESYLSLASALQKIGFCRKTVFATSNTSDYQQGGRDLHPDLRTEFSAVGLEYARSWSAARYELDRP
jgi:PIN domain